MHFNFSFLNMAGRIIILESKLTHMLTLQQQLRKLRLKIIKYPHPSQENCTQVTSVPLPKKKWSYMAVNTYELRNVPVRELKHLMNDLPKPASQISSLLVHNLVLAAEGEG